MLFPREFVNQVSERFTISEIVRKRVVLKARGKEHTGLCPFHNEKSPSFTVNDDKGFYHCFGCGAHGNMFDFIMQTEGLSFPETVEKLAIEAGMPLPKADKRVIEQYDKMAELMKCAEAAAKYFQSCLASSLGAAAREYLNNRGLKPQTIEEFRLGFCPDAKEKMQKHLIEQGFSIQQMNEIGLIRNSYEIFRGRVIFPITDSKGRVVAFGGRILDKGEPKYLNSPETPIFHKRKILFGKAIARKYVHETGQIIVTEGYMDTISLNQAGFKNSVAPLGTSLTEDHLEELWAMCKEPIMCLDGDNAGRRAMERAASLAVPSLRPGLSLKFVTLPDGQDPDDIVKKNRSQFEMLIQDAKPLSEVLFETEKAKAPTKTPEQQADLRQRLENLAKSIKDSTISKNYADFFRNKLWQEFKNKAEAAPQRSNKISNIVGITAESERFQKVEGAILGLIMANPALIKDTNNEEELAKIEFSNLEFDKIRQNILFTAAYELDEEKEQREGFEKLILDIDKKLTSYIKFGMQYAQKADSPQSAFNNLLQQYQLLLTETDFKKSGEEENFDEDNFAKLQEMHKLLSEAKNKIGYGD